MRPADELRTEQVRNVELNARLKRTNRINEFFVELYKEDER